MWRHVRAAIVLPGTVSILVPAVLLLGTEQWTFPRADVGGIARLAVGTLLLAAGLALWVQTVTLFAHIGEGTLAPWDPTRKLVVSGPYRRVRNPMISAVVAVLLGEAALFGSYAVLAWALAFFAVNAVYIPRFEEPGLVRRFGDEYGRYARHVRRWLPRVRPWDPGAGPRGA